MGKRELLLVVAFAVVGVVVYHVTTGSRAAGTEGASLSTIWHNLQRHIKGNQATAAADSTVSAPADGVRELRISIARASNITITGEARSDISASVHLTARGFNDDEARAAAAATRLTLDRVGDAIVARPEISGSQPRSAPAVQLTVALKIPRQLAVRIDPNTGALSIANVASVEVMGSRGELHVSSIGGEASITHGGAQLAIDGCGSLTLSNRGGNATIRNIAGTMSLEPTGGRLTIDGVTGPLRIDSKGSDLTLRGLSALKPPLRINAVGGRVDIEDLRTETHIDARNTSLDVALASAAPVTIDSTADDIAITPATAGYTLDAAASDGRITIADADVQPSVSNDEQRASGSVRGGGPALVLRTTHANINVRAHRSGK